jgi:hypothetical protein
MIALLPEYEGAVVKPPPKNKNGKTTSRFYTVNDSPYDRVTSILNVIGKPALVPWAIRETTKKMRAVMESSVNTTIDPVWIEEALQAAKDYPDEARDAAADRGNEIHSAIEEFVNKGVWPSDGLIKKCVLAYHEWSRSNPMEPIATEFTVWSPTEYYAGTIDEVCLLPNGHYGVIDFKTGGAYPEAALQVAAYANALEELTAVPVDSAWILRIPRDQPEDGGPQFFTKFMDSDQIQDNLQAFRNAMYLQRRLDGKNLWSDV